MKTLKPDVRFKQRYVLRTALLLAPPLVAFVLLAKDGGRLEPAALWAGAFFVAWIVLWIALDCALFRSYRCPSCGARIARPTIQDRAAGDPIRYACPACAIEWDTGLREPSD